MYDINKTRKQKQKQKSDHKKIKHVFMMQILHQSLKRRKLAKTIHSRSIRKKEPMHKQNKNNLLKQSIKSFDQNR